MPLRISALCALLLSAAVQAATAGGIDLQANREPIRAEKNPAAIALIPANFHFAVPGKLTVAVAFENSPPLALFAEDNKTLIGSDPDIARLVADSLGLALNLVPTSWEDWPLGISTGKYDAAIFNIAVTKLRKTKFDFATYRVDTLGFTSNPPATSPRSTGRRTSPGCGSSSDPAPIRKTYCWDGISKTAPPGCRRCSRST